MNTTTENFAPVHVGTSPAGVEYVAYKAEDVAKLEASLERQWARAKHRVKLTRGAVDAIEYRDQETLPKGGRIGRDFIEGTTEFLEWCLDALEDRVQILEHEGAQEMAENYFGAEDRTAFFDAANARRVKALRKQARKLDGYLSR